ncbi:hypothetical protein KY285_007800 [Solanum tuberosum]|nr:hypothetical protein KY285_007800 [Solanum tuberosum]
MDTPVEVRRRAIKTLTRLIPYVQFGVKGTKGMLLSYTGHISSFVHHLKLVLDGLNYAIDTLCCLAHVLGEDFTIFIPSIHKFMVKHRLQLPVEVISDPLSDGESDLYEVRTDMQKQLELRVMQFQGVPRILF